MKKLFKVIIFVIIAVVSVIAVQQLVKRCYLSNKFDFFKKAKTNY